MPIAAPPVSEGVFRRQRRPAGNQLEIGERLLVVVSVGEEVEILTLALRARRHPLLPVRIVGDEQVTTAVVHHGPSRTGEDALLHRLTPEFVAVASVQRAGRAHEVLRILHTGRPGDILPVEAEDDFQVLGREFPVFAVGERKCRRRDGQL